MAQVLRPIVRGKRLLRFACLALLALTLFPVARLQSAELEKKYAALDTDGQLLLAARNGDVKQVEQLLGSGASVHAREKKRPNIGRTALHYAAGGYRGAGPGKHVEVAQLLLSKGANVNAEAEGGYTPLHVASGLGKPEMVSFLLTHGANVNAKHTRATPLAAAVVQGHLEVVKLLLEHGADLNAGDSSGYRPIDRIDDIASWYPNHDPIFILLVEAGADLKPHENRGNPLWSAINRDRPKLALAMIDKGAVVDAIVVYRAGLGAHRDLAEGLIQRNIKVFTGENIGSTLLHGAACSTDSTFFDWVLANTPDVNASNQDGKTPLHMAARCVSQVNIGKLLEKRADVNRKDAKGRSPINDLFGVDTLRSATILLDAGASPNSPDEHGTTPLMNAVYSNDAAVARLLLERGADVNLKDHSGATALHEAAQRSKIEVAEAILSAKGIRVDELNAKGETALHMVARSEGPEMVPMLLKRGADKSLRTPEGKTALELAEARGGRWKTTADLLR